MENKEFVKKYNITKKTGILMLVQMILLTCALVISLFGVFKSLDLVNSLNRVIIYGGQALICCATILFGIYYFNKTNTKYFKIIIMAYALLEAIRVCAVLLNPFLTKTSESIFEQINTECRETKFVLDNEYSLNKPTALFSIGALISTNAYDPSLNIGSIASSGILYANDAFEKSGGHEIYSSICDIAGILLYVIWFKYPYSSCSSVSSSSYVYNNC